MKGVVQHPDQRNLRVRLIACWPSAAAALAPESPLARRGLTGQALYRGFPDAQRGGGDNIRHTARFPVRQNPGSAPGIIAENDASTAFLSHFFIFFIFYHANV
ncbi:hypothetical protein D8B20_04805 [Candidatus Pantoea soli]|uniref:Uncharacterized protein n=1 Tax=Candidatus Pantoea soli TaxID=3098669 RepID=A0A518XAN2_9GAMM|nr:hypothetical protein D8B20_04805 [Pantoea soli]